MFEEQKGNELDRFCGSFLQTTKLLEKTQQKWQYRTNSESLAFVNVTITERLRSFLVGNKETSKLKRTQRGPNERRKPTAAGVAIEKNNQISVHKSQVFTPTNNTKNWRFFCHFFHFLLQARRFTWPFPVSLVTDDCPVSPIPPFPISRRQKRLFKQTNLWMKKGRVWNVSEVSVWTIELLTKCISEDT